MKSFSRWIKDPRFEAAQGISRTVGRWLSDHLTGNQVTIIGMILCVPMFIAFLFGNYLIGAICLIISLLTDFADGALSRYQQGSRQLLSLENEMRLSIGQRINYRGVTHFGRTLDPLADKIRFLLVLYSIGRNYVLVELVACLTVVAVLLTLVRPFKQYLQLDNVGSNRFGKFKVWVEIVGMAMLVFFPFGLHKASAAITTNLVFVLAFIFGLASLAGQIITGFYSHQNRRRSHLRLVRRETDDDLEEEDF